METSSNKRQSARIKLKESPISTIGSNQQVMKNSEQSTSKRTKQKATDELELPSSSSSSSTVDVEDSMIEKLPNEMLLKVIKYLPTQTVLTCRKVNRKLCQVSSVILHDRPDIRLSFKYMVKESRYENEKGKTLEDLNKLLETSKNFPYTHFSFDQLGKLLLRQGLVFLKAWGENIKYFEVEFGCSKQGVKNLYELLFKLAPNIQHFKFQDSYEPKSFQSSPFDSNKKGSSYSSLKLSKLKVLDLSEQYQNYPLIIRDILHAAPKLEQVTGPWSNSYMLACLSEHDIKFFYDCQKLHLLRCVEIQPDSDFMTFWEKFPAQEKKDLLKFVKITLLVDQKLIFEPEECTRAGPFITDIVKSSKNTLRELTMDAIGFLPGIDWSIFENVKKLTLKKPARCFSLRHPFLPPGLQSTNILPNLQEIHFKALSLTQHCLPELDEIPLIPSVRVLTLSQFIEEPDIIMKLAVMCPNVTTLAIGQHGLNNFKAVGSVIWENMKKLKILHLGIQLARDGDRNRNKFPYFDSIFTGFSTKTIKSLMKQYNQTGTMSIDKKIRTKSSILTLKDLEKLTIVFFDYNLYSIVNTPSFSVEEKMEAGRKSAMDALTIVSKVCAFDLIPNLQVETLIEHHYHHGEKARREELNLFNQ